MKYGTRGKPKAGAEKIISGYKIALSFKRDEAVCNKLLHSKGRFILATNDLDKGSFSDQSMLDEDKDQQKVEGGFRFIKDPWFMVDSIFLKSPKRITALMMVMTLCLMVYNIMQYKLRQNLKAQNATLPNQVNKEIQNPTIRWIFQIMEGINILQLWQDNVAKPIKQIITNLTGLRKKIIGLLSDTAWKMYGLIQENNSQVLGI